MAMILTGGRHSWDCYCVECVFGFQAYDDGGNMALKGRKRRLKGRMKKRMGRGNMMAQGGAMGPMPGMPPGM